MSKKYWNTSIYFTWIEILMYLTKPFIITLNTFYGGRQCFPPLWKEGKGNHLNILISSPNLTYIIIGKDYIPEK